MTLKSLLKNLLKTSALVSVFFTICSCDSVKDDKLANGTNKFIVGTSADNPPYEYITGGEVVGFDIDLAQHIANHLGLELVVRNLDFNGLIPALLSDNLDAVVSGLSYTPERAQNVSFSNVYYISEVALLSNASHYFVDSMNDLQDKVIGVQFSTTWEKVAKEIAQGHKASVKSLSNNLILVEELNNAKLDAVIMEELQAKKFVHKYPNLKYITLPHRSEFCIATKKDSQLTIRINEALKKIESDGSFTNLKNKWFIE